MPGFLDETSKIMEFLANEVSQYTYIDIIDQYQPSSKVMGERYSNINRAITND
jgi:putative pyruvate formate lyase activating enzyme|tara:strand:+ start:675 stop:833 length:159 start_codon:yes stop_codon:yes gene_type:complete